MHTSEKNLSLVNELRALIKKGRVLDDASSLLQYGCDWTRQWTPEPLAIVLPRTLEEVRAVVLWANQNHVALVPSGGRTGLSGGAVARSGEVVLALDLINDISEFNTTDCSVRCGAGVVTRQLQEFAEQHNLYYPVDFASSGSSQIGGNISTNAGGIKVIRYGLTRDWVAGLTVVTGKGDVLSLNKGLIKNATGYDLRHLFIGAEGTLGIVVDATIRLTRQPKNLTVLVLGTPDFASIMQVLNHFQSRLDLTAFEFFSEVATRHVVASGKVARPFAEQTPYYALLEFEAETPELLEAAMTLFEFCVAQGWVLDGVMSQSESQAKNLWKLRESISETISVFTPYKNDISITVSNVPAFITEVDVLVNRHYPDFDIVWFGHIGDGNVHLNILKPANVPKEEFFQHCQKVSQWVFEIVQKYQGSISAEHGVGLLKQPYLHYSRSAEEIAYMKAIKQVFDPNSILNPGKVL
ncbi:MAG TPA: FAD-binding oxidoreductase [Pseudomonadales bacterium]|nr:FAD-binding oxidoreductase [Pseudomonadales bacterium]